VNVCRQADKVTETCTQLCQAVIRYTVTKESKFISHWCFGTCIFGWCEVQ